MIGKHQIEIDWRNFVKGMSSSAEIADGGFSPDTDNVNLTKIPGVLYAPALSSDADTDDRLSTTISIIASSPDMATIMADRRLLVGVNASEDGTFFRYDGTKIIAAAYATDTTRNYGKGFTDIITFGGEAYVTSKSHIARWQNDNTITQDFFAFITTTVFHPALVFENNAYYGDGNTLKRATAINTAPTTILTLSTDQIITALGTDPSTGYMLISVTSTFDASNTGTGVHKVMWYDGYSNKVRKSIVVEDLITAFHVNSGTVFVGYGQNIGYLTGGGINFLRKLKNVGLDSNELPFKHNFTSIGNTTYVLDDYQVLAFGKILPSSPPVFYYAYSNSITAAGSTTTLTFLSNGGSGRLLISQAGQLHHFDTTSVATTNTMSFYTNIYNFPRPVYLRGAYVQYVDAVDTASSIRNLRHSTQTRAERLANVFGGTSLNSVPGTVYEITDVVLTLQMFLKKR